MDNDNSSVRESETSAGSEERKNKRRWRMSRPGVVLLLLVVAGFLIWRYWPRSETLPSNPSTGGAIQVIAARAHKGDIGVYVTGLGSVTPLYTVTVNSRVDGQLMNVSYKEGQPVHKGDLLAEIDPRPYQVQLIQAQGALSRDQALLDNARIDLDRYQTLWAKNAIQEQQLATQKALVKQDEGNVKTDQGQIASAQLNLTYCHITAPITGRLGLRLVDPGNIVAANSTAIAVITQMQPISVIFTIGEDQLTSVRQHYRLNGTLPVTAFDSGMSGILARGSLETIDNQIDPTTGTVKLRALFANKDEALFPNQFVNAQLRLEEKRGVTLIPNAAIQRNGSQTYVWSVQPDQTVASRTVSVGTAGPSESEIVSGLSPSEVVVTDGVDRLQQGTKVAVQIQGRAKVGG